MKKLLAFAALSAVALCAQAAELRAVDVQVVRFTPANGQEALNLAGAPDHHAADILSELAKRGTVKTLASAVAPFNAGRAEHLAAVPVKGKDGAGNPVNVEGAHPVGLNFIARGELLDGNLVSMPFEVSYFELVRMNEFASGKQKLILPQTKGVAESNSALVRAGDTATYMISETEGGYIYVLLTPQVQ